MPQKPPRNHPDVYAKRIIERCYNVIENGLPRNYSIEQFLKETIIDDLLRLRRAVARAYYLPSSVETTTTTRAMQIEIIKEADFARKRSKVVSKLGLQHIDLFGQPVKSTKEPNE